MAGVERFDRSIQGLPQGEGVRPLIGQQQDIGREPHVLLIGASTSNERPERPKTPVQRPADRSGRVAALPVEGYAVHAPVQKEPVQTAAAPIINAAYWETLLADLDTSPDDVLGSPDIEVVQLGKSDPILDAEVDVEATVMDRMEVHELAEKILLHQITSRVALAGILAGKAPEVIAEELHPIPGYDKEHVVERTLCSFRRVAGVPLHLPQPAEITVMRGDDPSDTLTITGTETKFEGGGAAEDKYRIEGKIGERDVALIRRPNTNGYYENWRAYKDAGLPVVPTVRLTPDRQTVVMTNLTADGSRIYGKSMLDMVETGDDPDFKPDPELDAYFVNVVQTQRPQIEAEAQQIIRRASRHGLLVPLDALDMIMHRDGSWKVILLDVDYGVLDIQSKDWRELTDINIGQRKARVQNKAAKEALLEHLTHLSEVL